MKHSGMGFVKPFLIILGSIVAITVIAFCIAGIKGGNKDHGDAIDFTAKSVSGQPFSLRDNYGVSGTVLIFWDRGKSDCEALFQNLSAKKTTAKLVVISKNDSADALRQYCAGKDWSFDTLIADDGSIFKKYNVTSCPISYFIDRNGSVRAVSLSSLNADAAEKYLSYIE